MRDEFIFIALVIFAATQWGNRIARRTADEIERRNRPAPPPKPKSKQGLC